MIAYEDAAVAAKYLIKTNYVYKVIEFHPEDQTVDIIQDVLEFCNTPGGEYIINNEFGIDVAAETRSPCERACHAVTLGSVRVAVLPAAGRHRGSDGIHERHP